MYENNTTSAVPKLSLETSQPCSLLKQAQTGNDMTFAYFRALCAFLSCTNAFFAAIAILGNAVVFAAFYRSELLRTPSNLLLLGLSFCDFLAGVVTQPLLAAETAFVAANSGLACTLKDLYVIFLFAFSASSMLHVCFIGVERSLAIFHPFKHQLLLTKKRVVAFLVFFWISWTLLTVFTRREHGGGSIGYSRMGIVICIAVFMIVVNVRMWIEARRHSRLIQATLPRQSISEEDSKGSRTGPKHARDSKAAKTVLLIIGLLMLCNLPLIATFSARKFYGVRGRVVTLLWFASNTIVLLPATLNPVIYCWRRRDIRLSVKRTFGCPNAVGVQRQ